MSPLAPRAPRAARLLPLAAVLALAACEAPRDRAQGGSSERDAFVPALEDAGAGAMDAGPGAMDAGGGAAADAGLGAMDAGGGARADAGGGGAVDAGVAIPPTCQQTCATPSDCAVQGSPLYDASHYACSGGVCAWRGCVDTADCEAGVGAGYVCVTGPAGPAACLRACQSPADCASASPITDADHWRCGRGGLCEWLGCASDLECEATYQRSGYVCVAAAGAAVRTCLQACSGPADCVVAGVELYGEDNWACADRVCTWRGCTSTAECTATFQSEGYVCR